MSREVEVAVMHQAATGRWAVLISVDGQPLDAIEATCEDEADRMVDDIVANLKASGAILESEEHHP